MTAPVLQAKNIDLTFEQGKMEIPILHNVNYVLNHGEQAAIVGASGSGKSSLLHVLGGLLQPTDGEVLLHGETFSDASANRRARARNQKIGFVYQFHHLLPEFTALENVALPLMLAGTSSKQAHADAEALLSQVGLSHRLTHRPSALSGGERQRVAIARALVNQPDCVLADEPTGNLDSKSAEQVMSLLLQMNQTLGTALLVVTHDAKWASKLSVCYHMQDGQLKED